MLVLCGIPKTWYNFTGAQAIRFFIYPQLNWGLYHTYSAPTIKNGAVSRKHFRADSPVFFDLNHGHLTLAIIMA